MRMFAKEGAKVTIGDILEDRGRRLEMELRQHGDEVTFVRLDVTSSGDWNSAVQTTLRHFGKLNVLVNNAGISDASLRIEETSEESWEKVMSVNAKGVFLGTKSVIEPMRQAGVGIYSQHFFSVWNSGDRL